MGAETIAGLAVAALAAGGQAYQADQTAKRASAETIRGIEAQNTRQRQADQAVAAQVADMAASNPAAARAEATDAFLQQLRAVEPQARGDEGVLGGTGRFEGELRDVRDTLRDRGATQAGIAGRIAAPGLQREREMTGLNDLATSIGAIANSAQGDAFLNQLRLSGIRSNPWVTAGLQTLGAAGSSVAAGGGSGGGMFAKAKDKMGTNRVLNSGVRVNAPLQATSGFSGALA